MADLIDRQAALEIVRKHIGVNGNKAYLIDVGKTFVEIIALPSAESERKKGKWIWDDEGYHCSECWFHAHGNTLDCMDGTYRFCPNCGAEMVGET